MSDRMFNSPARAAFSPPNRVHACSRHSCAPPPRQLACQSHGCRWLGCRQCDLQSRQSGLRRRGARRCSALIKAPPLRASTQALAPPPRVSMRASSPANCTGISGWIVAGATCKAAKVASAAGAARPGVVSSLLPRRMDLLNWKEDVLDGFALVSPLFSPRVFLND